jgi:hypothetical protein
VEQIMNMVMKIKKEKYGIGSLMPKRTLGAFKEIRHWLYSLLILSWNKLFNAFIRALKKQPITTLTAFVLNKKIKD